MMPENSLQQELQLDRLEILAIFAHRSRRGGTQVPACRDCIAQRYSQTLIRERSWSVSTGLVM